METKKWYQMKLVWLGLLITLQGIIPVVVELVNKQAISPADILLTASGIVAVIIRVWFTSNAVG